MQFREIIGQQEVKSRLMRSVIDQRISHAQLFYGPEGSGKLALAIAYAQFMNCENRQDDDSCGVCPSCNKYQKLIHPDLHFIYPVATTKEVISKPISINFIASWREFLFRNNYYVSLNDWYDEIEIEKKQGLISANDCNDIIKTLSYKSYEAEYKVMIIWMAEKLFYSAAPKILKILEEPPDKTLFILITENHEQILPTIISRTQLVKIPKIPDIDLLEAIRHKSELTAKDLRRVVNVSDGNYNEAIRLLTQTAMEEFNFTQFTTWMRICFTRKMSDIMSFTDQMAKLGREAQKSFFLYALRMIRFSVIHPFQEDNLRRMESEEAIFIGKFSPFINSVNREVFIEELNKAIYHIERNANANIMFIYLTLKFAGLLRPSQTGVN